MNRELQIFELTSHYEFALPSKATVCLLIADHLFSEFNLEQLVIELTSSGCCHFMTWGDASDVLHDALDEILENGGGDLLNVVTTSHAGESVSEMAWFFVNAALPGEKKLRCCVGYSPEAANLEEVLMHIRTAVHGE